MDDDTSKEPPIQTMSGAPIQQWNYEGFHQYHPYSVYQQYYNNNNQFFINNLPPPPNMAPYQNTKSMSPNISHSQFQPSHPGVIPLRPNRPIRFNLNTRKSNSLLDKANPLLGSDDKKNYLYDDVDEELAPKAPPPLPSCPPPLDPPPPPPPLPSDDPPPLPTQPYPILEFKTEPMDWSENISPPQDSDKILNVSGNWPDSLDRYIKRCYEKCKTPFDRDQIDICLKGRITAAANKDEIWTRNWDNEPIPSVYSEKDKLSVKTVPGTLALYQNSQETVNGKGKVPLSARLGRRQSPIHRRRRTTRSRSNSTSPVHKKQCSPKDHFEKTFKNKGKGKKNCDRIQMEQNKKNKNKNGKKKASIIQYSNDSHDAEKLQRRAERFNTSNVPVVASSLQPNRRTSPTVARHIIQDYDGDYQLDGVHIVGTCLEVEKSYLRLTKQPQVHDVRPVSVLKESLKNVKDRWIQKQDYRYACDQLKSIRQDLVVQGVRDGFTIHVYETHARIALEKGDHEEFNQCQAQLKTLYSELPECKQNANEFTAYRILYYIYTKNSLDLTTIFQCLSKEERVNTYIKHALDTRSAWSTGNLHKFFILYKNAPLMAGYLIDWFVERERKLYLRHILKAYVILYLFIIIAALCKILKLLYG